MSDTSYTSDAEGLREAASDLAASRAVSTEVQAPAEPLPRRADLDHVPDRIDADGVNQGVSFRDAREAATEARAKRLQREDDERRAYEAAAGIGERELPDLEISDAELNRQELAKVHQSLEEVKAAQDGTWQRLAEQQQLAQEQALKASQLQTAHEYATQVTNNIQATVQEALASLNALYPDVTTPAHIEQMRVQDPYRYQVFIEDFRNARAKVALAQQDGQHALGIYAQAFNQLGAQHDEAFLERHPELKDEAVRSKARYGVLQMLKDAGYDDAAIYQGWNFGAGQLSNVRDHRVQTMLLEQWRLQEARKSMKEGRARPLPPVTQRPGVGGDLVSHSESRLRDLNNKLKETGSFRDAVKLRAAALRYKRG
jgi:hypothetical protein